MLERWGGSAAAPPRPGHPVGDGAWGGAGKCLQFVFLWGALGFKILRLGLNDKIRVILDQHFYPRELKRKDGSGFYYFG